MQYSTAIILTMASIAFATPDGCKETYPGSFSFGTLNVTSSPAAKEKRQTVCGPVAVTLNNGILHDSKGTGEVVGNHQFQFDITLQEPRITASGFSICPNSTLASGDSTIFYQCLSGNFYNLYDQSQGKQCNPVYIPILPCQDTNPSDSATPSATASSTSSATSSDTSSDTSSAASSTSMSGENVAAMMPTSTPMTTPSAAAPTTGSTYSTSVVASTAISAPSGNGTTFTPSSPSATSSPQPFKGTADSLAVGKDLGIVALGLAGFAFAL